MDFKKLVLVFAALGAVACQPYRSNTDKEEYVIGVPLAEVSGLTNVAGDDSEKVVIFDETTRKIHQFKLSTMTYLKSLTVKNSDKKHVVLSHEDGNYVLDFSEKNLTIFDADDTAQVNPIKLPGNPVSAAFRSDDNLLVVYDDMSSTGIVQMNSSGKVLQAWAGGPLLGAGKTIAAGDLLTNNRLVLSMSDNSIAVVDVVQTLAQKKWIFTTFASGMTKKISWLSPVRDNANQILARTSDELAIIDISSQSKIATLDLSNYSLEKLSKAGDGHVVARANNTLVEVNLFYPKASAIENRQITKQSKFIASSFLSTGKNFWSFVEMGRSSMTGSYIFNNPDYTKNGRSLKKFELGTMLATDLISIRDSAQVLQSPSYIFALFPSELGYATCTNVESGDVKEAKFFNVNSL